MRSRLTIAAAILATVSVLTAAAVWLMIPGERDNRPVIAYLSETRLTIPYDYFRFEHARLGGSLSEIDLAADARTFRPARLQSRFKPSAADPMAQTLFLTLIPSAGNISPAERTTRLYTRFLQPDGWSHPRGLIMRRFKNGSPYQKEDLYMAPPEGRRFAARCPQPRKTPDGLTDICMAEFRIEGIDVRLRFAADLLSDWERLLQGTQGLIRSFRR
jgi:hypothetical protein